MKGAPAQISSLSIPTFFQLQEEERYRLARALTNGPGQILANALVELEHSLPLLESDPALAAAGLAALRGEVRAGLAQLQALVAELQPPLLAEMGLGPSLHQYVQKFGERYRIEAECVGCESVEQRLPSTMETALFRIVQEALANVSAHSSATRVQVHISHQDNQLQLVVHDNGRGFAPRDKTGIKHRQLGLAGMSDRADLIGGHLQVFSERGKGVRVVVTVPYHADTKSLRTAPGGRKDNGREN